MSNLTRRSFFTGAAAMAAGSAVLGLAACSPQNGGGADPKDMSATGASEADPIEPMGVPDQWDLEADVVVVGMGGGGVNATAYAAEQGASVIALEKEQRIGGASRHAGSIFNVIGGTKEQNEVGYGWPTFPVNVEDAIGYIQKDFNYTLDDKLLVAWQNGAIQCMDWMAEHPESNLALAKMDGMPEVSFYWTSRQMAEGETGSYILGMEPVVDGMASIAEKNGAQIFTGAACEAFVQDDGRVVGIVADINGTQTYIKANKGVILTAGGFGMNLDMLEKWIPTAYRGAACGGPMPMHTGEVTRMALGVGADMAGFDSFGAWHGFIDEARNGDRGDGAFWHFFYHGERQLVANPWLTIDKLGNRVPYYTRFPGMGSTQKNLVEQDYFDAGDVITGGAYMGRIGGRSYQIFDADYPTNVFKIIDSYGPEARLDQNKCPFEKGAEIPENARDLVSDDWQAEVREVIERGGIQKADTLEELAVNMGLDPDRVVAAVNRWNELCEIGEDLDLTIPYDPAWLIPVKKPPYYGACVSGCISKTLCGLRVNENLQVIDTEGGIIPGLYAGFSTAGGFAGEGCYAGDYNPTILGGCGASFASGFMAAKALLESA